MTLSLRETCSSRFRPRFLAKRPRGGGRLSAGLLAVLVLLAGTVVARRADAQDQGTLDKLVQLNKKAMDDYDTAEFDAAKKALLEAEKLGKRSGMEGHPIMARTYIHLGALYLVGYRDKQKAQHYFGKALDIQGDIKLDKNLTSPAVRDLFASVQSQKGGGAPADEAPPAGAKGKAPGTNAAAEAEALFGDTDKAKETEAPKRKARREGGEPELPANPVALECPYPDDTPPQKKVTLRCVAAPDLHVAKVALYYKGFEMTDYERVDMTKSAKGWEQATIPKKRVDGKSLQFYFEGLDASDKPVVSNGRAESPNVMLIVARSAKLAAGDSGEDENPLDEEGRPQSPRLILGTVDDDAVGIDTRYGNRRFWLGLGLGTGMVYAVNGRLESRVCGILPRPGCMPVESPDVIVSGFGWAGLAHLVPEIGIHITPNWAVSVQGRHQYINQDPAAAKYTASGAHAVLLKVMRFTKQNQLRFFYGVAGGGGEGVRMNIWSDPSNPKLKDTVLVGGTLIGGTGGLNYEFGGHGSSFVLEVNALYGFPKTGITFDLNASFQFHFGDTSGRAEKEKAKRAESVAGSIDDEDPK